MSSTSAQVGSESHACSWPGCQRAYKRAEHLERHQKSHSGDPGHRCRHCGKLYSRSDVLARHLSNSHGEQAAKVGRPRKAVCTLCTELRSSCDGQPPKPCTRCQAENQICRYRYLDSPRRSRSPIRSSAYQTAITATYTELSPSQSIHSDLGLALLGHLVDMPLTSPARLSAPSHTPTETLLGFDGQATAPRPPTIFDGAQHDCGAPPSGDRPSSIEWMPAPPDEAGDSRSATWLTDIFLTATAGDQTSDVPWDLNQTSVGQGSVMDWDWGFTDFDSNIFEPIATRPTSPALQPNTTHVATASMPEKEADLVLAVTAREPDGRAQANDVPESQRTESPWPNLYKPSTPEWIVELPPASGASVFPTHSRLPSLTKLVNPTARQVMQTLTEHAHQAFWPTPDLGNFPSAETLTVCINLYLSYFAPWLPILDSPRGSFRVDKAAPIVLKAMAAIGSAYSRTGDETLGLPLAELVRREILFIVSCELFIILLAAFDEQCEHDQRFIYELGIIQASLLQSYFGLFSGSPKLFQQAEVNRASLVTTSKRMRLLQWDRFSTASERADGALAPEALKNALHRDHRRCRLGWAIFLFDAQLGCLFGLPAQYPLSEIDSPMPTVVPDDSQNPATFGEIMSNLLDKGTLPHSLDDVARSCIAYALYRLCLDASSLRSFSIPEDSPFTPIWSPYRRHPQELLHQMARQIVLIPSSPSALAVSCAALAYHSHLQFTGYRLLETIRVAAGKSGSEVERQTARANLFHWMTRNSVSTRNIFANAAMLGCLLNRFTFDTPAEVVWTFDAALCMWACLSFSNIMKQAGGAKASDKKVTITWTTSSAVDAWITTGDGDLIIRGMGGLADSSVQNVLQSFADRLEVMSWGLANRYRKVLLDLLAACKQGFTTQTYA